MKFLFIVFVCAQLFGQSIKDEIQIYLKHRLPEYEKIEFNILNNLGSLQHIMIDSTRNISINRDIILIPVEIIDNQKKVFSLISLKVQLFKKILVANKDINKSEPISSSDISEKLINVTKINGTPLSDNLSLKKYRAKTFIKKNEILLNEKLEITPLINYGDKVTVEVRNGHILVTTEALARQQGAAGDFIDVVSTNNKIIRAKITDANKVIVE